MRNLVPSIVISFIVLLPCFSADLQTYKETYDNNLGDIVVEHGMKLTTLANNYTATLKNYQDTVQKAGDFEKTKTIIAEIERFSKDKTVTEDIANNGLPDIKKTQLFYIKEQNAMELAKARKIITLSEQYDRALGLLLADLTKQGKLSEATAVHAERQKIQENPQIVSAKKMLQDSLQSQEKKAEPSAQSTNQAVVAKSQPEQVKLLKISEIEDPAADFCDPNVTESGLDIRKVSIQSKIRGVITIDFQTEEKIPKRFKGYAMFLVSFEFVTEKEEKEKAETGFTVDLNVRIYFDAKAGQWKSAVDSMSPVTAKVPFSVRSYNVTGNKVSIEIKSKLLESLSSIRYNAHTHMLGKQVDWAPDNGFAVFSLVEQK
ncbi:MAG: hypothetical protein A2283_21565 [Lentisphaerae bacterium RIFOXYA12_FULL_48_11]|nr:MAG: hypothetical protein A2283_21565 [Lentisphaerae bacterium RIFOXYA12_FULL_48_11]